VVQTDRRSAVYVAHKSGHTNAVRQTGLWHTAGAERSYEKMTLSANILEIKQFMRRVKDDARVSEQLFKWGIYLEVLGRAV
jgi:hypothetical protein